ncbi:hypothetical protein VTK73DRAFT_1961 [Phialemonium thermophilum]|uniref:Uncharacterized protein n=1 Tax=Phialemonium thermophilum TaxID=223376 RepID=A0ABR3VSS7_9PEZI
MSTWPGAMKRWGLVRACLLGQREMKRWSLVKDNKMLRRPSCTRGNAGTQYSSCRACNPCPRDRCQCEQTVFQSTSFRSRVSVRSFQRGYVCLENGTPAPRLLEPLLPTTPGREQSSLSPSSMPPQQSPLDISFHLNSRRPRVRIPNLSTPLCC